MVTLGKQKGFGIGGNGGGNCHFDKKFEFVGMEGDFQVAVAGSLNPSKRNRKFREATPLLNSD